MKTEIHIQYITCFDPEYNICKDNSGYTVTLDFLDYACKNAFSVDLLYNHIHIKYIVLCVFSGILKYSLKFVPHPDN